MPYNLFNTNLFDHLQSILLNHVSIIGLQFFSPHFKNDYIENIENSISIWYQFSIENARATTG
jgi:hypothetical protein